MKFRHTISLFCCIPVFSSAAENSSVLRFLNGDQIHGTLVNLTDKTITWQGPNSEPTPFPLADLQAIRLVPDADDYHDQAHYQVTLINDDTLPAQLKSLTQNELTLQTIFAGELKIPKNWVKSIEHTPSLSQLIYWGPNTKDQWPTLSNSSINNGVKNQALKLSSGTYSSAGPFIIAPSPVLPDDFELSFNLDLAQGGVFSVYFHCENNNLKDNPELKNIDLQNTSMRPTQLAAAFGSGLVFQFSTGSAQLFHSELQNDAPAPKKAPLHKVSRLGNVSRLSNDQSYLFKGQITIRASRSLGVIQLLRDQQLIAAWNEPEFYPKAGNKLIFTGGAGKTVLNEIRLSHWNRFPDAVNNLQSVDRDVLLLFPSGDRLSSDFVEIKNDFISLSSPYGQINTPLNQLKHLSFATQKHIKITEEMTTHPITLLFNSGESIRGKLQMIGQDCHFVSQFGASWPIDTKHLRAITFGDHHHHIDDNFHEK